MKPVVALVGRPNVGKSTIFNRLTRSRKAIVHDEPGVTRDRHYGDVVSHGRSYILIDTGGFDPTSDDPMRQGIKRQIELAIAEADVIVCVFDAMEPATNVDHAEMKLLRAAKKPTIYIANKADSPKQEQDAADLYRLGMEHLFYVSAAHGHGFDDLAEAIADALPPVTDEEHDAPPADEGLLRVALIGKPNAGKSSLVNRLSGAERVLVDDRPGTTRAAVDTIVERKGKKYVFVDTAGIRRKAKVTKEGSFVEGASVVQAIRAMEHADVVVLLADAAEGVAEQDAKILGLAEERGRGIVIALNKIDLINEKGGLSKAEEATRDKISFAPWAPICRLSAKTGRGTDTLLETIEKVGSSFVRRVPTGELNRFFASVLETHPPPTHGGRAPRLYFITQASSRPPTFVVSTSAPDKIHFSYRRYVQNQIRKAFAFEGVPVVVHYRGRGEGRKGKDEKPGGPGGKAPRAGAAKPMRGARGK